MAKTEAEIAAEKAAEDLKKAQEKVAAEKKKSILPFDLGEIGEAISKKWNEWFPSSDNSNGNSGGGIGGLLATLLGWIPPLIKKVVSAMSSTLGLNLDVDKVSEGLTKAAFDLGTKKLVASVNESLEFQSFLDLKQKEAPAPTAPADPPAGAGQTPAAGAGTPAAGAGGAPVIEITVPGAAPATTPADAQRQAQEAATREYISQTLGEASQGLNRDFANSVLSGSKTPVAPGTAPRPTA